MADTHRPPQTLGFPGFYGGVAFESQDFSKELLPVCGWRNLLPSQNRTALGRKSALRDGNVTVETRYLVLSPEDKTLAVCPSSWCSGSTDDRNGTTRLHFLSSHVY